MRVEAVGPAPPVVLINIGDTPSLVYNSDPNNTVYLTDSYGDRPETPGRTIPLPPGASIPFSGKKTIYGMTLTGASAAVLVMESALNFFSSVISALTGNLIAQSIQSPNFDHGVSGWQVTKTGDAEFNDLILRGTFLGTDFIIDATGAFFYSGTPALGNLIVSIASVAGVDSFGNAYSAGCAAYATIASGSGAGTYAITLADQTDPYTGFVSFTIQNLTHPANVPPGFLAFIDSVIGNQVEIRSGKNAPAAIESAIQINDSLLTGASLVSIAADTVGVTPVANAAASYEINGSLILDNTTSPASSINGPVQWANSNGFPQFLPASGAGGNGDTTQYKTGHRAFWATTDQSIISTTYATVCGTAPTVGIGSYRVRAVLTVAQGATSANNNFRLGFAGTISQVRMSARFVGAGGVGNSVFCQVTTSNEGLLQAPAFAINATYVAEFEGLIITTSSGALSIQAAEQTSGDTFKVLALSFFEIFPAN